MIVGAFFGRQILRGSFGHLKGPREKVVPIFTDFLSEKKTYFFSFHFFRVCVFIAKSQFQEDQNETLGGFSFMFFEDFAFNRSINT